MSDKYLPIPVKIAREIGEKYNKAIVIINTWDTTHALLHTTTWGLTPEQKIQAAIGGEVAAQALGADLSKKDVYQDFRKPEFILKEFYEWFDDFIVREMISPDIAIREMPSIIKRYLEENK